MYWFISSYLFLSFRVIISSEEEDNTPEQMSKVLRDLGVGDEALLEADDFLQKFTLRIRLRHTYVGGCGDVLLKTGLRRAACV